MSAEDDQLPRIFQANLHRFYIRIIEPGLSLRTHAVLTLGEVETMDAFLDAAAAHVDNYTANEAAKAFTLIVASLFERHLRILAGKTFASDRRPKIQHQPLIALVDDYANFLDIDISYHQIRNDLEEAQLVAHVVRHGDGPACATLQFKYPTLWNYEKTEYLDLSSGESPMSELMRIRPADVTRYVRAGLRFWGLVDLLPMAIVEPPI